MRRYEVMYIVKAALDDAARQQVIDGLHAVITNNGGEIEKVDNMGMKEFAYPIEDMLKGYYVVTTFKAENQAISEFDRLSGINTNVVRHMIIKLDEKA